MKGGSVSMTRGLMHIRACQPRIYSYSRVYPAASCALRRGYASESEQYKHSYPGPPPPAPPLPSSRREQQQSQSHSSSSKSVSSRITSSSNSSSSSSSPSSSLTSSSSSSSGTNSATSSSPSGSDTSSQSKSQPSDRASAQKDTAQHKSKGQEAFRRPLDGRLYAPDLPISFGINQHAAGIGLIQSEDHDLQKDLESIMQDFRAPIRYAFAYGSGVFKQKGYDKKDKPMLDFVFAVSHPNHWHSINIHQNKDHYSLLARTFGSNIISILQNKVGAGVWFNVECQVRGRTIKYGVISVDTLVHDLMDWNTLYMAGRMQKPINVLRDEPRIKLANQVNLSSAVRASLLLLPETFSEEDLYSEIASLSYRGDFRMSVGENPNKIKNIVSSQGEYFSRLYSPILRSYHRYLSFLGPEGSGSIRQDINPKARAEHARRLPLKLRDMLHGQYERESNIIKAMGKSIKSTEADNKPSLSEETALWMKLVGQGNFKHNLDKSEF